MEVTVVERHPPWLLVMMMIVEDFGALGSITIFYTLALGRR